MPVLLRRKTVQVQTCRRCWMAHDCSLAHCALWRNALPCSLWHSNKGRSFYATQYSASNHVDLHNTVHKQHTRAVSLEYRGADKSLARPTSRCILFDVYNISFDASLVLHIYIYIYITNISLIMIINRIYVWNSKIFCRCSLFRSWSG